MAKQSRKEVLRKIALNNKGLLEEIIIYITSTYNITRDIFYSNTRDYIKRILKSVRDNNNKVKYLRKKRTDLRDDIHDLEASMVGSQSFDDVQAGRNNGLIPNTTEIKYIKRISLKEELGNLLNETLLIEKSLEHNNSQIKKLLSLLPSETQSIIMQMTYIDCMQNVEIASTLLYSIENVDIQRWRGIKELVIIFECVK